MTVADPRPVTAEPGAAAARPTATSATRRVLVVLTVAMATVAVGLALTGSSTATGRSAGLADAGRVTTWLLPLSRSVFDLGAIGTVGVLVALGWLVPVGRVDAVLRLRRAAAGWAALWAGAAALNLLAAASQVVGVPIDRLLTAPDLLWYGIGLPQGRAMMLVVIGAVAISAWIGTVGNRTALRWWAVGAASLMAPLLATGHAATASNHFLATETLLVHVVAVTVWMGGLLALVLHLRPFPQALPVATAGFSRLALACFVAVAASGLVGAWTRLGLSPDVWVSTYGVLVLVKTAVLLAVGAIGWWHRRHTLPALATGRPRAFARLAWGEVLLMSVAVGLAVVLARTSPPIAASLRATPPHAAAFPTVDATLPPLGPVTALTATRPDALVLSVLLVAAGFLLSWARWRQRSARRLAMLLGAVLLAAWALVGALGAYATSLYSAQVVQVLVLAMVVPPLLVRGLPLERLAQLDELIRRPMLHVVTRPVNAVLLLVAVLALVLQTPVLAWSLRSELGHLALELVVLLVGLLVFVPMAVTAGQESVYRGGLLVVAVVLAWYAVRTLLGSPAAAGGWYVDLDLWWADAARDQLRAGGLMGAASVAVVGIVVAKRLQRVTAPAESEADRA